MRLTMWNKPEESWHPEILAALDAIPRDRSEPVYYDADEHCAEATWTVKPMVTARAYFFETDDGPTVTVAIDRRTFGDYPTRAPLDDSDVVVRAASALVAASCAHDAFTRVEQERNR